MTVLLFVCTFAPLYCRQSMTGAVTTGGHTHGYGESYHGELLHHVCPDGGVMEGVMEGMVIIITGHTQTYMESMIMEHSSF